MKSSKEKWTEAGEKLLKQIGIREDQKVVDFGCGSGNYTFPAARIVGKRGSVYALDKDKKVLNELMHKAESMGIYNIFRLDVSKDSEIPLDNESVDVVLLFDVLHFYYFPEKDSRKSLLHDIHRVLKAGALLLLCPTHLQSNMEPKLEQVQREIGEANFDFECEYSGTLIIHDKNLEENKVMCFRKTAN
ncbi:MAG TPA: class I SAM-dependent methyltransferase [Dehalococcoidia bacterium]|nr:class I SAM-dependent methyltransferase [Dehalococcoidia bacterium]